MFRGNVSLRDVAEKAGVSAATVCLALNNRPGPSAATRQLVRRTAQRLGYVPNLFGKVINHKKSGVVGVVVPVAVPPLFPRIVGSLNEAAESHGWPIFVSYTQDRSRIEAHMLRMLGHLNISGLVLAAVPGTNNVRLIRNIAASRTPIVQVERVVPGIPGDYVGSDNAGAAAAVTRRLIAAGHRRIGLVLDAVSYSVNEERLRGYRNALVAAGLAPFEGAVLRLAENKPRRTAILNWLAAPGAPRAVLWCSGHLGDLPECLAELKLVNGRNIEVVLFDADPDADLRGQSYTIVLQDAHRIGREALTLLANRCAEAEHRRRPAPPVVRRFPCCESRRAGIESPPRLLA